MKNQGNGNIKMTMDDSDELLMLSALQHFVFCERQCALIHIEQAWSENMFTAEGRIMHERVDTENRESRGKVRIEFGMPLRSLRLGITGRADVVEFHRKDDGTWQPFPVEYKRGKPKGGNCDRVQLCAQALCLEEMIHVDIPAGALFYGQTRHRHDVVFDKALRDETENAVVQLHRLMESGVTPPPVYSKKCDSCSLYDLCLPKMNRNASKYLLNVMRDT